MLLMAMSNNLFFAPLPTASPLRVLDIGTGTGIWAIDFASQYPSSHVIGTDLSPTQPSWAPSNVQFQLDDAQLEWTFPDNHFDYIHLRLMMGSITDWPALYKEAYRCLKPGGWIEHHDNDIRVLSDDGTIGPDSPWAQWGDIFYTAGDKIGRTFKTVGENLGWLKAAGFQGVQERRMKLPLGSWPKDPNLKRLGVLNCVASEMGLEGFALYVLTQVHGWEAEETKVYLEKLRKEIKDKRKHGYYFS